MVRAAQEIVDELRTAGSDTTAVEVKAAAGGFPQTLTSTLSALANHPGGGVVILGLDEMRGFIPVTLSDPVSLKQGLGSKARTFQPPIHLDIHDDTVDGAPVIIAFVQECSRAHKPCRGADGKAYVRSWDGDYETSDLEDQAFLLDRSQPRRDSEPVGSATIDDLDDDLVRLWRDSVNARDAYGLGRFEGAEQLRRGGVLTAADQPTLAGLLALGIQPQEYLPGLSLRLSRTTPGSGRATGAVNLTGPLPYVIDAAMEWAAREIPRNLVTGTDGHVRDTYDFPLVAFRELISNALVHRSFDPWALGMPAEARLQPDRLVVISPGGLYGITVARLGHEKTTTTRNSTLVGVSTHTSSPTTGGRVIEALSTGIRTVLDVCDENSLPSPIFSDTGVRFTAVIRSAGIQPTTVTFTDRESAILDQLLAGPMTAKDLAGAVGTGAANVRKVLRLLVARGLVTANGGRGLNTTYQRAQAVD